MDLGDLLVRFRKEADMTIDQLAEASRVPKGTINKIIAGTTKSPSLDTVCALADALGKSINDFVDIPANKKSPALSNEALKLAKTYDSLDERGQKAIQAIADAEQRYVELEEPKIVADISGTPLPKANKTKDGFTELQVYTQPAAAGLGNYLDDPDYHIEQFPSQMLPSKVDFGVKISGDSMEPKIPNGCTAFVYATPSINDGEIGIFVLDGQAYCKQIRRDADTKRAVLHSLNPKYEDIIITEANAPRTLGRVIAVY